jgi:two-component system sensor histidine kinase KdpD
VARGKLRIYVGAAPGVGKTFAMLDEGWRRHSRGTDVVVGIVETHGRPATIAQLRDLEIIPRLEVEYRGQHFEELDLDAVLARKPAVAIVDELAHTNVPGVRNTKRWEDIEELLDAGIDVLSTVNVQHLESLNDVVEQITGTKQNETVPDGWVRAADQIELVDMTPEALRRRMAHGNVYTPEKVDVALANYFRVGNLTALRELALLWMADRVDEEIQEYRERHDIAGKWETKERVLVALTGAPGSEDLVRRAGRTAMRTRGVLIGAHVASDDGLVGSTASALDAQRKLLEQLGGRYVEVVGADVAQALVQVARTENATQLILGASRRSRWHELVQGSVINSVVRAAGGSIDVHVISTTDRDGQPPPPSPRRRPRLAAVPRRRQLVSLAVGLVGVVLLTLVMTHFRSSLGLQNAALLYLLFVLGVATIGGTIPAMLTAVGAFLALNWFFAPPFHTFTISNGRDLLTLATFITVAAVVSTLVDTAARRRQDAHQARAEAQALTAMAGMVLREPDPLPQIAETLTSTFNLDGITVFGRSGSSWIVEATAGPDPPASLADADRTLPLGDRSMLAWRGEHLRADAQQLLAAFATQLAVAVQSRRLAAEASTAATLAKANEMRTALLAAVSHDLRTPLASIRTAATSLLADDVDLDPAVTKELLETIDDEAERLNTLVGNLLDMSRLQTGHFRIEQEAVGVDEVVGAALLGLHTPPDRVKIEVSEDLPQVVTDPSLLERAVANLLDNALGFSPDGVPITVTAGVVSGQLHLRVIDSGRGIPIADRDRVFQPFQRLDDNRAHGGVGLGLAVAHGFVEAIGGELTVEDTPGGGTTMVITLPVTPNAA